MINKVDSIISANEERIIESLRRCIRIPSVKKPPEGPGKPFGAPIAACLEDTLELAEILGFQTKNLDGYVGIADWGQGEETLGILCHLDVVPEGSGWSFPPFGAELTANGRIYGRGALDDKGPAIASLYALWAVAQAGVRLGRKVRVILGCDEESGWECMEHYAKNEPMPDLAFSPDAEYPVVHSEKGILQSCFQKNFASRLTIHAGTRPNVVVGQALAMVPLPPEQIQPHADRAAQKTGCAITVEAAPEGAHITVRGTEAHASLPEQGNNALTAILALLADLPLEGEDRQLIQGLNRLLGRDMHGESLAMDCTDESGRLTVNPGVLHWDQQGIKELYLDLRCPVCLPLDQAQEKLAAAFEPLGLVAASAYQQAAHYVPRDSELVAKLLDVYARRTGERLEPLAIGGGTYARTMDNAVAFGCERPGHEAPVHMPNEYISVEDLMFNVYLIADAIVALGLPEEQ